VLAALAEADAKAAVAAWAKAALAAARVVDAAEAAVQASRLCEPR